jgi:hypothetical protein
MTGQAAPRNVPMKLRTFAPVASQILPLEWPGRSREVSEMLGTYPLTAFPDIGAKPLSGRVDGSGSRR